MMMYIILWIIIFVILLYVLYRYKCNQIIVDTQKGSMKGPHVIFITAVHGNEKGPYYAVKRYMKEHSIKKGKLTHIIVNICGLLTHNRENGILNIDINRNFDNINYMNREILDIVKKGDYIVDFHESLKSSYNSKYIGNVIFYNKQYVDSMNMVSILNNKFDDESWIVSNQSKNRFNFVNGTLLEYCYEKDIPYILIETSRNNALNVRVKQTDEILNYIYDKYLQ